MSDDRLEIEFRVNTEDSKKNLDVVENGFKQVDDAAQTATKTIAHQTVGMRSFGRKAVDSLDRTRERLAWMQATAVAAVASIGATFLSIKSIADYTSQKEGLLNLGVSPEYLSSINAQLGNTLDKTQLIKQVQGAVAKGTDLSLLQDAAKAAAHLAKQLGLSKEEMFAQVSAGELQEGVLQRLGMSQTALNNKIAQAAASMGLGTTELDAATKRTIQIKAIIEATRKQTDNWKGSTAQTGDEAARTLAALKDTTKELGVKALPYMLKLAKGARRLLGYLDQAATTYKTHSQELKEIYDWTAKWMGAIRDATPLLKGVEAVLRKITSTTELDLAKRLAKTLKSEDAKHNALVQKQIEQAKKRAQSVEAQQKIAASEQQRLALAALKRRAEAEKQQYLADLRARQDQALDLIRNFSEKIVQTVADQGGSFGTVASALTDIFEKTRTFASTKFGLDAIQLVSKTIKKLGGDTNRDLIRQVELQAQNANATRRTAQAAQLLAGWIRGGADDTAEFLANEKAANAQLKAGLSTLQAQAKIASLRVEQANLYKDVTQFAKNAETTINALNKERNRLLKVGNDAARAKASIHSIIIQRLEKTKSQFTAIAAERKRILGLAMSHAEVERELEETLIRQRMASDLRSSKGQTGDVKRELGGLKGKDVTPESIAADTRKRVDAERDALKQGQAKLKAMSAKHHTDMKSDADKLFDSMGSFDVGDIASISSDAARRKAEIDHQIKLNKEHIKRIKYIKEVGKEKIRQLTFVGQAQKQFEVTTTQWHANAAAQLKSTTESLIGGFAESMRNVLTGIAKGDENVGANFGKSTLEALANLSIQWGSFMTLQGIGMLAGYQPSGGAVLTAGIGLTGLGVGLGVASSLLSPSLSKPASAGAASNPQFDRIPGTEPKATGNIRETYVLVNAVPWRKPDARDFVAFNDYLQDGKRMTGLPLGV
jgi:hypothetical protein